MSEKYMGKYRNESARLQNWDYGSDAAYFITICTKDRNHFFGEIKNHTMEVSPAGAIAFVLWHEIKNHAQNIELGEFVVMPNHIHGILILDGNNAGMGNDSDVGPDVGTGLDVGTRHALSLRLTLQQSPPQQSPSNPEKTIGQKRFQNQGKNTISSIVGSYKSAVTKYCNRLHLPFGWQSRFHDHIIRDEQSFQNISRYIINNPLNWSEDQFFQ